MHFTSRISVSPNFLLPTVFTKCKGWLQSWHAFRPFAKVSNWTTHQQLVRHSNSKSLLQSDTISCLVTLYTGSWFSLDKLQLWSSSVDKHCLWVWNWIRIKISSCISSFEECGYLFTVSVSNKPSLLVCRHHITISNRNSKSHCKKRIQTSRKHGINTLTSRGDVFTLNAVTTTFVIQRHFSTNDGSAKSFQRDTLMVSVLYLKLIFINKFCMSLTLYNDKPFNYMCVFFF